MCHELFVHFLFLLLLLLSRTWIAPLHSCGQQGLRCTYVYSQGFMLLTPEPNVEWLAADAWIYSPFMSLSSFLSQSDVHRYRFIAIDIHIVLIPYNYKVLSSHGSAKLIVHQASFSSSNQKIIAHISVSPMLLFSHLKIIKCNKS